MTERQQTGVWFMITGLLLLSLWIFAYKIMNWFIDFNLLNLNEKNLTEDQLYVIGASGVVSLCLASVTGIPLLITGLAQFIIGKQTKKNRKK